jgi:hypothetical protein
MSHWNFWEWLAYAGLWVAGIIEAAEAALIKVREIRRRLPAFLRSRNWAFAPLGVLLLSTIILVANEFDLLDRKQAVHNPSQQPSVPAIPSGLTRVERELYIKTSKTVEVLKTFGSQTNLKRPRVAVPGPPVDRPDIQALNAFNNDIVIVYKRLFYDDIHDIAETAYRLGYLNEREKAALETEKVSYVEPIVTDLSTILKGLAEKTR